jgi:hypothetical protein
MLIKDHAAQVPPNLAFKGDQQVACHSRHLQQLFKQANVQSSGIWRYNCCYRSLALDYSAAAIPGTTCAMLEPIARRITCSCTCTIRQHADSCSPVCSANCFISCKRCYCVDTERKSALASMLKANRRGLFNSVTPGQPRTTLLPCPCFLYSAVSRQFHLRCHPLSGCVVGVTPLRWVQVSAKPGRAATHLRCER